MPGKSANEELARLRLESGLVPEEQAQSGKQVEGHKRTEDAMTREDIATERALKMHDLALSVMREKGTPIPVGPIPIMEYRRGLPCCSLLAEARPARCVARQEGTERRAMGRKAADHSLRAGPLGAPSDRSSEGGRVKRDSMKRTGEWTWQTI